MNAGFSSLAVLKAQLLAEALRLDISYDAAITAIGLGVAAQFEKFCNRKFQRTAGDTFVCTADRDHVFLLRYPVETVTTVELKVDQTTGYETQSSVVLNRNDETGYVFWGGALGPHYARIRFTYTGGYWWDTTEDSSDTLPSGATALPDDLKLAWILQCRAVWQAIDKTGIDVIKTGSSSQFVTGSLGGIELLPQVKEILNGHIRYQMT